MFLNKPNLGKTLIPPTPIPSAILETFYNEWMNNSFIGIFYKILPKHYNYNYEYKFKE